MDPGLGLSGACATAQGTPEPPLHHPLGRKSTQRPLQEADRTQRTERLHLKRKMMDKGALFITFLHCMGKSFSQQEELAAKWFSAFVSTTERKSLLFC